jgi:hypothetical protein
MLHSFKNWLTEEHDGTVKQDHHIYHTKDGHEIHIHLKKDEYGTHAEYENKHLGGVVKTVSWMPGTPDPTKHELEHGFHEDDDQENLKEETEQFLSFKQLFEKATTPSIKPTKPAKPKAAPKEAQRLTSDGNMTPDTGGKVTELATVLHGIHWKHKHAGTFNPNWEDDTKDADAGKHPKSGRTHGEEAREVRDKILTLTKGAKPEEVQNRITHGKVAMNAIVRNTKRKHGKNAQIHDVAHTSQAGDIPTFTRGQHNDTQENTSDVGIEISGSNREDEKNSDGTIFRGNSLKSSKKKQQITAKNPGSQLDNMLDSPWKNEKGEPDRVLRTDEVGRKHLEKNVWGKMAGGKYKNMTAAERGRVLDAHIEDHKSKLAPGVKYKSDSPMELEANEKNMAGKAAQSKELHEHLQHLMKGGSAPSPKRISQGHALIGKMLESHLFPTTSMANDKVRVSGEVGKPVRATIEENSEHPMKKILRDPKTRFVSKLNADGRAVNIGFTHPKTGEYVHLATYAPKPKSNAFKSNNMGWTVQPAASH